MIATTAANPIHLIASHCKPWRDSTNEKRLNGENGLLLTPSIDHLFDRGIPSGSSTLGHLRRASGSFWNITGMKRC